MSAPEAVITEAVIFDLDGTLVDSYAAITDAVGHAMRAVGQTPATAEAVRGMVGWGLDVLLERAVGKKQVAAAEPHYRARYQQIAATMTTLLPGAEALTRGLHAAGIPLAIASNKPSEFSRQILDALGLSARFAWIFGPAEAGAPKPAPAMLNRLCAALAVDKTRVLYVGDMAVDLQTARAAGVRCVIIGQDVASLDALIADLL